MQTASSDLPKQPTTPNASDHGERRTAKVAKQSKLQLIMLSLGSSTLPTSSVNAKLRVGPKIQEVHAPGREVLELVRQCAGMGGFYLVLEAIAQGVLIAFPQPGQFSSLKPLYI